MYVLLLSENLYSHTYLYTLNTVIILSCKKHHENNL